MTYFKQIVKISDFTAKTLAEISRTKRQPKLSAAEIHHELWRSLEKELKIHVPDYQIFELTGKIVAARTETIFNPEISNFRRVGFDVLFAAIIAALQEELSSNDQSPDCKVAIAQMDKVLDKYQTALQSLLTCINGKLGSGFAEAMGSDQLYGEFGLNGAGEVSIAEACRQPRISLMDAIRELNVVIKHVRTACKVID